MCGGICNHPAVPTDHPWQPLAPDLVSTTLPMSSPMLYATVVTWTANQPFRSPSDSPLLTSGSGHAPLPWCTPIPPALKSASPWCASIPPTLKNASLWCAPISPALKSPSPLAPKLVSTTLPMSSWMLYITTVTQTAIQPSLSPSDSPLLTSGSGHAPLPQCTSIPPALKSRVLYSPPCIPARICQNLVKSGRFQEFHGMEILAVLPAKIVISIPRNSGGFQNGPRIHGIFFFNSNSNF